MIKFDCFCFGEIFWVLFIHTKFVDYYAQTYERENKERERVSNIKNENEIVLMKERVTFALRGRMFINETDTCKLSICEVECPCYFTCGLTHYCYYIFSLIFVLHQDIIILQDLNN